MLCIFIAFLVKFEAVRLEYGEGFERQCLLILGNYWMMMMKSEVMLQPILFLSSGPQLIYLR